MSHKLTDKELAFVAGQVVTVFDDLWDRLKHENLNRDMSRALLRAIQAEAYRQLCGWAN